MSNHLTTEEIIDGCRRGQAVSQRALVDQFSASLFSVCLRYIGSESKSKDVLQESFIRIFKSFKNFDSSKGSLQGWMRKITVNMALKTIEKEKIKFSPLSVDFNNSMSVEPSALHNMEADDLLKVVQTLPDGYRQVFNLSVIEGYSHKEIAQMLDIQEVSSRSNLSRAKQILRNKLIAFKKTGSWVKIM
ncbi:MAG: sigma-70 family RNA polymerase sigma factor [Saprospiraceae bacterium]|nr:sigma-70 family RNA polymerase sigma factor [Saprospiraceae bacterium]